MNTFRLTVGPDGRVAIPETRPGQTITVQIAPVTDAAQPMTLATAKTDEDREAVVRDIKQLAQELRDELGDEAAQLSTSHGDLLYGDDGLPK